ncbi:hypothetical protein NLY39_21080 [Pseudomonas sp. KHPS1]|nr:hypothetical protein [Pseudomonas sp. KHPS1]UTH36124.1 hypothetical protein NLY39_21080 [Pseudomonas sp. KHPS1]
MRFSHSLAAVRGLVLPTTQESQLTHFEKKKDELFGSQLPQLQQPKPIKRGECVVLLHGAVPIVLSRRDGLDEMNLRGVVRQVLVREGQPFG